MKEEIFKPEKIAVIGASRHEGKTGHEVFDNLIHEFEGKVYPVNPNAEEIHGYECRNEVEKGTDLAVIVVPAKIVPKVIEDCGQKNVEVCVVISAGFSESGNKDLEDEIKELARKHEIDLLGPNVLGLINTENKMNASFASKTPENGDISFMSQSGAFCTAILDYAEAENIGFRHFVSLGNKIDLNEIDFLKYWRDDETNVILSYTEGIENGREFIKQAKKTSKEKPIIMIKSGRTNQGGEAAKTHTGSIAGSYQAYQAAFQKTGIIEAESNRELLEFGRAFSYQEFPEGENISVITNAGGPGVITADEIAQHGLKLAKFEKSTEENLENFLPQEASVSNPLDIIGDAKHDRYKQALEQLIQDDNTDSILIILTPQANTEIKKTAKTISKLSSKTEKPVFACFMGEKEVEKGTNILEKNKVPSFNDPVAAVKTLEAMNNYKSFLDREETYRELDITDNLNLENYIDKNQEYDFINRLGFKTALTEKAHDKKEAVKKASNVGHPVVMKILSNDIGHKTDVGGVKTGLENRDEVESAYEEIMSSVEEKYPEANIEGVEIQEQLEGLEVALGLKRDPQFGPMVMVGLGGIYIEALHDVSFGIPPITEEEAERMINELESHQLFQGIRGKEFSIEPVKDAIIRLGEIGLKYEDISSIDINPLILRKEKAYVSDISIEIN